MERPRYNRETSTALSLLVALARCNAAVFDDLRPLIRDNGLTESEFGVLEMLYHLGPQPLGTIARKLLIRTAGTTHVIDTLEAKGLVRRAACPKDRRVIHAELTDMGRERIAGIFPAHAAAVRVRMSVLTTEEQETLARLLRTLGTHTTEATASKETHHVTE